jgi:hypothetical protein
MASVPDNKSAQPPYDDIGLAQATSKLLSNSQQRLLRLFGRGSQIQPDAVDGVFASELKECKKIALLG